MQEPQVVRIVVICNALDVLDVMYIYDIIHTRTTLDFGVWSAREARREIRARASLTRVERRGALQTETLQRLCGGDWAQFRSARSRSQPSGVDRRVASWSQRADARHPARSAVVRERRKCAALSRLYEPLPLAKRHQWRGARIQRGGASSRWFLHHRSRTDLGSRISTSGAQAHTGPIRGLSMLCVVSSSNMILTLRPQVGAAAGTAPTSSELLPMTPAPTHAGAILGGVSGRKPGGEWLLAPAGGLVSLGG